jgi:hypothetical protein
MYNNTSSVAMIATSKPPAGIDKLMLTTTEYSISDDLMLNVKPFVKLAGQSEAERDAQPLFKVGRREVYGEGAYINNEHFNVSINRHGMQFICNPSKILHPYELLSDAGELSRIMCNLETELSNLGVHASLASMNVARIDIAKQAYMPRLVSNYAAAFEHMKLKGSRSAKVMHNLETFGMFNNSVQACFYDKLKEQNPKGMPSNLMRAEMRLMKRPAVKNYAGLQRLHEVIKAGGEGWQFIYDRWMQAKVYASQPEQLTFDFAGLQALAALLASHDSEISEPKKKGGILKAATVIGTKTIFDEIGIDRFIDAFEPYYNRSTLHRAKQQLMKHARLSVMVGKPINTLTLIDELKAAFLQAA